MKDIYDSLTEAAEDFGVSRTVLSTLASKNLLPRVQVKGKAGAPRSQVRHMDVAEGLRISGGLKVHQSCPCSRSAHQLGLEEGRTELAEEFSEEIERWKTELSRVNRELELSREAETELRLLLPEDPDDAKPDKPTFTFPQPPPPREEPKPEKPPLVFSEAKEEAAQKWRTAHMPQQAEALKPAARRRGFWPFR